MRWDLGMSCICMLGLSLFLHTFGGQLGIYGNLCTHQMTGSISDTQEWNHNPDAIHEDEIEPEVEWMPELTVREVFQILGGVVDDGAVQLTDRDDQLEHVTIGRVVDERMDGQQTQRSYSKRRDALH